MNSDEIENKTVNDIDDVLNKIDSLSIYEKDYDIIISLMENIKDKRLFVRIVEEVLNKNLAWSDFESFLSYTDYGSILDDSIKSQKNIEDYINRLSKFRDILKTKYGIDSFSLLNNDVSNFVYQKDDKDFYKQEINATRNNIIYEIIKPNSNDNAITTAVKSKLLDDILKKDSEVETNIFLFSDPYNIPIDYRYQSLNSFDRDYMQKNNLDENQMKQFKELSFLLRRKMPVKINEIETGGE